jgi:benzylsuccinate CoA-transferase BbsE subunit
MKVLEISHSSAASNAGLLLAQLGFQVERLDCNETNQLTEAQKVFFQRGKKDVLREQIEEVSYDAIVEDVGPDILDGLNLSVAEMLQNNESLIVVSLSGFGLSGPYSGWASSELTVQAAGGVVHVSGYDGEPPVKLPGNTAAMIAGIHGATAAVTGVYGVSSGTETGVHVDISAQDTLMQHWTRHISQYAYTGTTTSRGERDPEGIHFRHTAMAKDGWVYMLALRAPWQDVARFLGLSEYVDVNADNPKHQPWEQMESAFHESIALKNRYDWFTEAAEMGWTFAPVESPFDIMSNPQNQARDFFEEIQQGERTIMVPGLPYRIEN